VNRRWIVFLLCGLAVCTILILAASMHDVEFQPGQPLVTSAQLQPDIVFPNLRVRDDTPLSAILMVWLAFAAVLLLGFLMLPPEIRKRILRQIVSFAFGVLALVLALRYGALQLPQMEAPPDAAAAPGMPALGAGSLEQPYHAPTIPSWFTFAVALLVVWAILAGAWYAWRMWAGARAHRRHELASIARIAANSLGDLAEGRRAGDVILETYARMNEAVGTYRGLRRRGAATPREFAHRLEGAGLPSGPVGKLTELFEMVRYGGRESGPGEIREAVTCLESILRACGAQP
jgi:hypothetical protein